MKTNMTKQDMQTKTRKFLDETKNSINLHKKNSLI